MNAIGYAARVFSVMRSSSRFERARHRIDDDVFEHGAEAARRRINLRLGVRRQPDRLGVAAAFEVEDARRRSSRARRRRSGARRVARQRRFARAGEPEEQRDVAARADVRRTVHRQDVLQRQQVIQHA